MTSEVLSWVQKLVRTQSSVRAEPPKNFTKDFADGKTLCAIFAHIDPVKAGKIAASSDRLALFNQVFDAFLEVGVPRLLDAEDMLVEPYPDKLSVATYCIEIRRRWDALTNQFGVPAVAIAGASAVAVGETASSAIAESSLLAKAVETLKAETIHQQHLISSLKAELSAVREQIAAKVSHASARATPSPDVKRRDEMAEKENRHQQELMRVEIDAHLRTIARLRDQLTEQKQKTGQKQSSGGFVTSVVCFLVGFSVGALVVYLR